jgi:hypothetical protein
MPLRADFDWCLKVYNNLTEAHKHSMRQYMSGPLKDLLDKEISAVEGEAGQTGHFSLDFGYNSYRKKEALDVLVLGYRSVLDTSGGAPASAHGRSKGGRYCCPERTPPRAVGAGTLHVASSSSSRPFESEKPGRTVVGVQQSPLPHAS